MGFVDEIRRIESKWQERWEKAKIFEAEPDPNKPKYFLNGAYPYVNGRGHVGHLASTFLRTDIDARYRRMKGYNVLYAQGFHATGQPICAAARRIAEGDPKQIAILKLMGVPEEEIPEFSDPKKWIKYFVARWIEDLKKIGVSVDWRRTFHTTELNPPYDAFIRWQYNKLRELGLIGRGKHPVVWCPKEKIPIGDHGRLEGEGVVPEEVVIIKFEIDGKILPAATYRPETAYGVTNLWINPEVTYVEAQVDGETWIISKEAAEFLSHQREVKVVRELKGEELIGKNVKNPVTGETVPILPAGFVDPEFGTGVVMSVPAHAPYDWIALKDLESDPKFGEIARNLKPRSLIKLEGYSEFPAKDACEKYGVRSQEDREALEKATEEIYKKEFYEGILKDIFGDLAGKKVCEAKEEIIRRYKEKGWADTIWILPEPVICRCTARCVVKIVDQWFLRYSDPEWKEKAHKAAEETEFIPPEAKRMVHYTIDWLRDWAATRDVRTSLGTKLPWDETQYIESLSDSTVYMAYYTISHYLQSMPEIWDKLDDEFFDYVFYEKGDPDKIAQRLGVEKELLEKMRAEFEYWYPVDSRYVGKDLIQNHVTFSIFHHAVLFPGKHIRRWVTSGHVLWDGVKMSKSKGNVLLFGDAVDMFGADPVRFATAYSGNVTHADGTWETKMAEGMAEELIRWIEFVESWYGKGREDRRSIDSWLESKVSRIIKAVDEAYEEVATRDVINRAWYEMWRVIRRYLRRTGENPHREIFSWAIEAWIKMMAPITPHVCEEAWERIGKEPFVSLAQFPEPRTIDEKAEMIEEYVERLEEDIRHVLKLAKVEKPEKIVIVPAEEKIYEAFRVSAEDPKKALEILDPERKAILAKIIMNPAKRNAILEYMRAFECAEEERKVLEEIREYLEREFGVEIIVNPNFEHEKAKRALPGKPAVIVL